MRVPSETNKYTFPGCGRHGAHYFADIFVVFYRKRCGRIKQIREAGFCRYGDDGVLVYETFGVYHVCIRSRCIIDPFVEVFLRRGIVRMDRSIKIHTRTAYLSVFVKLCMIYIDKTIVVSFVNICRIAVIQFE